MKNGKKGATLVEVMIALSIVLFMTSSIAGIFYYSAKLSKQDTAYNEASNLAETNLEIIKSKIVTSVDFGNLKSDTTYQLADSTGTELKYIYNYEVRTISLTVKCITVTIYHRNMTSTSLAPDLKKPNNGRILKMGTIIIRP
jgi:Na+/alanine symporter